MTERPKPLPKIERKPPPPSSIRLEQGRYPSKLRRTGERTDIQIRLGLAKLMAESQGLHAPKGMENDQHFWGLVVDAYSQNIARIREKTKKKFKRAKPNTIIDFSRDVTLEIAVNQAKMLVQKEIERLTDGLTGAWSRFALDTYLTHLIDSSLNQPDEDCVIGLLFLDIDNFKEENDSKGHAHGDNLLINTVKTLKKKTREKQDMVGRYGGDELAVILPGMPSIERLATKAEEMRITVKNELGITLSIGLAIIQPSDSSPKNIYKRADLAVYAAKRLGKNRTVMLTKSEGMIVVFNDFSTGLTPVDVIGHVERTTQGDLFLKTIIEPGQ